MYKQEYSWNQVYNLVMKIKNEYIARFGATGSSQFESWLVELNKDEYNDVFSCLQVNQQGNELLIRYGLAEMQAGMWSDSNSIYRECRSIVIDLKDDAIIICPFRKFFNLNEVEENKIEVVQKKLATAKVVEYSDKKDGSMQSARWYNGEIKMYGSMALKREDSWRLDDGYNKLTINHRIMIMAHPEYTFIFEYISLADSHVVKYKKEDEGLYLIGMRNVYTGEELSYNKIKAYASLYGVPMTDLEDTTLDEILKKCKNFKSHEKEGWVINIDGQKIKLKCDDYVALHRMLDYISSVNVIIENVANETYDDLLSKVPENYQDRVQGIADQIYTYIKNTNALIDDYYAKADKTDKKTFMVWIEANVSKDIRGYVRCKYLGQNYNVIKTMYGNIASYKKAADIGIKLDVAE